MSWTKPDIILLRAKLEAALATVAKDSNMDITVGNILFNSSTGKAKIQLEAHKDGVQETKRKQFEQFARAYGLLPTDFNLKFRYLTQEYQVAGLNTRAKSYPIEATNLQDGKTYGLPRSASTIIAAARGQETKPDNVSKTQPTEPNLSAQEEFECTAN